ncbi:hypothetical protein F5Y06DRAFT_213205 [Hypoxylon sp. FL0890]|nr:hypothetical protein F5Y06DRAFT_213205 [Hypoxylon sp. FL0890]
MQNNNTPSSSRPLAARVPGQLHTPTHSFSEAAFTPESVDGKPSGPWNDRRSREEFDITRIRLLDQKFKMGDYPDPLLPRQHPKEHYFPKEVTRDTEQRLLKTIAEVKGTYS